MAKYRENLIIAIPALNEELQIQNTIDHLKGFGEIIVFDNNSHDKTCEIVLENKININRVINRGYENVVFKIINFFLYSEFEYLCIIDGDGEVGLNEINDALTCIENNSELDGILGKRNRVTRISEKIVNFLFRNIYKIDDIFCGFKILKKSGISINLNPNTFGTSIIKKDGKFKNFLVELNSREDSRLDSDPLIGLKILYHGIKGLKFW